MRLEEILSYRENNRLEAKRALGRDGQGELPRSIWETISAFANTEGGIIVLGVAEQRDGTLEALGIPQADKVLDDFWNAALSDDKLSTRLFRDKDVQIEMVDGKQVLVINVPWANRRIRPIYINGDLFGGTFRRMHTGDHLCSREEVLSMVRDSDTSSQDSHIAESAEMSWIDNDTLVRYRRRFETLHPGHAWNELSDEEFLVALGATRRDGKALRPTRAGLLMFGLDRWIIQEFPHFLLDYRQETGSNRWEDRLVSFTGDWTGNVYDFFFRTYQKLMAALKVPFKLSGVDRIDDTSTHKALREALANCLTNANWFERRGVSCIWHPDHIEISNPGDFRMPIEEAKKPGNSDPRNETLLRMFSLINIGERAGSGIDELFYGWHEAGFAAPHYEVSYGPDRTVLRLPLLSDDRCDNRSDNRKNDDQSDVQSDDGEKAPNSGLSSNKVAALDLASKHGKVTTKDLTEATGLSRQAASVLLKRLAEDGLLVWHGSSRNDPRQYYLPA